MGDLILDGFGRAITVLRDTGGTTVSEVDTIYAPCACSPTGKIQKVSMPYVPGNQPVNTIYTYDGMGRTVSVLLPDGASTTTYAYSGNTTTITDPAGKWKMQTMDAMSDLIQVNEPDPVNIGQQYVTQYTYDLLSHLTLVSMTRPSSGTQTRTFAYDSNQRLQSETHPESGQKTYTYNTDGTLATRTDANGHVTKYFYDIYKRLILKSYWYTLNSTLTEDTCQRLTLTYDTNTLNTTYSQNSWGRLVTAQFWGGPGCPLNIVSPPPLAKTTLPFVQMYSYSVPGQITGKRLILSREPAGQVQTANIDGAFTYDNEGHMLKETYPVTYTQSGNNPPVQQTQQSYAYSYDGMGRPYSALNNIANLNWPVSAQYGPSDELTALDLSTPNVPDNVVHRIYNSLLQMTSTANGAYTYTYPTPTSGNNGRITSMTHVAGGSTETVNYGYDSLNRLSSASGGGVSGIQSPWSETYTYDGFGNLLDKNETGGAPTLMQAVNASTNQITGQGYDNNGNQLSGGKYDYENRIMLSSDLYVYGPDNVRVWKARADGTEEIYFYDPAGRRLGIYYELTASGSTLYIASKNTSFYFKGELLSTTGISVTPIDRLGSTYNGFGYFPFGEEYKATTNDQDKFATYYRDATTGLDYAKNRYYSNTLGRFLSADPYLNSAGLGNPGSWNRYAYTSGDPVNKNDPRGLEECLDCIGDDGGGGGGCDPSLDSGCSPGLPGQQGILPGDGGSGGGVPVDPGLLAMWVLLFQTSGSGGGGGGAPPKPTTPHCDQSLLTLLSTFSLDYSQLLYKKGTQTTMDHIIQRHMNGTTSGTSQYYGTSFWQVENLNDDTYFFGSQTYDPTASTIDFTFNTATFFAWTGKTIYIGTDRSGAPTATNLLILKTDCKTVVTSYPIPSND